MSWRRWIAERFRTPTLGELGERAAARHLRRKRYKIVARRHASRYGEFDLIAVEGQTIVFVEVKTRRSESKALDPACRIAISFASLSTQGR